MTLLGQPLWYWFVFAVAALVLVAVPIAAWLESREANRRWGYLDVPFDPSREWMPASAPYDEWADEWEKRITL